MAYKITIQECSRELTAQERIKLKDTKNATKLDEATADGVFRVDVFDFAVLQVETDSNSYHQYMIISPDGEKYVTGSDSFYSAFRNIYDELAADGVTQFTIDIYKMPSKNYAGKSFLTCSLV